MSKKKLTKNTLEILEARIAPAAATTLPTDNSSFVKATLGAPVEVKAGQVLNTTGQANDGSYLLYVEEGNALVFFTDLNNNRQVDFNEITGISAGDGLRMVVFTDIHGDIVTNLRETTATFPGPGGVPRSTTILTLSDSDSDPSNDPLATRGDGRVLLNSTIEKIEMRSLRTSDIPDQNGDGVVDDFDLTLRGAPSTYSIFGSIFAGGGFGAEDGGLIIDSTRATNFGFDTMPVIGSIRIGTAASGEFFSFGVSRGDDISGTIGRYLPDRGVAGGSIVGVKAFSNTMKFQIDGLYAGDGGIGAKGGDIRNIILNGDDSGGYVIQAGNGGGGLSGGAGGSVLAFSDLGSSTSKVVIRSGDGGTGATGTGGSGGQFSFDNFNLRGNVAIELGDGGDGFTKGGNGAGLSKGDFAQPDITFFRPGEGTGTTHLPSTYSETATDGTGSYVARFGKVEGFDFDLDGIGDFVYTTTETSQLVVMFGTADGSFRTTIGPDNLPQYERVYLSGVRNPEALTVGDFNADGHPDIAVASADEGSHSGIAVFISKYEHEGPGDPTGSEDLNGNKKNDFLGFSGPRFSTLPLLRSGDPLVPGALTRFEIGVNVDVDPAEEGPVQVSQLVAGDFDGDGKPELAVLATYYTRSSSENGVITELESPHQVLLFLTADTEVDNITGQTKLTGQFYADFGSKGTQTGGTNTPPEPRRPFTTIVDGTGEVVLHATALTNTSDHDVLLVGIVGADRRGANVVSVLDYDVRDGDVAPRVTGSYRLGYVDTDRDLGADKRTATLVTLLDFTPLDYNGDGNLDIAAIATSPDRYVVFSRGDGFSPATGLWTGIQDSGGDEDANGVPENGPGNIVDNAGAFLNSENALHAILSADVDGDGFIDDIALLKTSNQGNQGMAFYSVTKTGNTPAAPTPITGLATSVQTHFGSGQEPFFFDLFYPDVDDKTKPVFGASSLGGANAMVFVTNSLTGFFVDASQQVFEIGLRITAGNGGDSSIGNGGKGGGLGGGATVVDVFDDVLQVTVKDLLGSLNFEMSGDLRLIAGSGGNGFASGGAGGDVSGVTLRYREDGAGLGASLAAGHGGRGVSGAGGAGGSIFSNSLESSLISPNVQSPTKFIDDIFLEAGDGGPGRTGGNGGSVRGNGTVVPDAITSYFDVRAGNGGAGTVKGGSGGSIRDLAPVLRLERSLSGSGDEAGNLFYYAGFGGGAIDGRGGDGGSIIKSAPRKNAVLNGAIELIAGDAGAGTIGGNGGSVRDFQANLSGTSKTPASVLLVAGHGGVGTAGNGGEGGSLTNLVIPSRGLGVTNRAIAGNGGASASAKGGNGGVVTDIRSSANEGSFALAGGAGGHGLIAGGNGGSVLRNDISVGASTSAKVLVIAGAGGDASAFIPAENDDTTANQVENAFGGRVGRGGNGGDIVGFTQTGSLGSHVDLIAGNGGSTLNYGVPLSTASFAGRAGSIKDIRVSGDIGNVAIDLLSTPDIDENVTIKSYNNIFIGETVTAYVENKLRQSTDLITDADGNVGIVVGVAGRNKATFSEEFGWQSQPSGGIPNGSLINVTARNLMSAVAGNVDRIASIQLTKGIKILNGIIGADKGSHLDAGIDVGTPPDAFGDNKGNGTVGVNDYLLPDADTPTDSGGPVRDGALVDGALVTRVLLDDSGKPTTLPGRVFII